jgi:hypothetical protein
VSAPGLLLTPEAVRERSAELHALGLDGGLHAWTLRPERLPATADLVARVVRDNYPSLAVPFHARWRHFATGGQDRWAALRPRLPADAAGQARAAFDAVVVSVLLDAGAGMAWRYRDTATGATLSKSEGLGVASLAMFAAGTFAADGHSPRADASRLAALGAADLAAGFQAGPDNPLVGLDGRAALLRRLGETLAAAGLDRPGALYDALAATAAGGTLPARDILITLLRHLGPIWPGRVTLEGVNLGDCWHHPGIRRRDATAGLIPFHKLSQWLAYSLIEPLQAAGITVTGLDSLTGLPEYRNGGLFLDMGVIVPRDPAALAAGHAPGDLLVVEWRALTVALLDAVAPLVRARLGLAEDDFPLARVLEGGTWTAGRRLAAELRADGGPPVRVVSDGTVF